MPSITGGDGGGDQIVQNHRIFCSFGGPGFDPRTIFSFVRFFGVYKFHTLPAAKLMWVRHFFRFGVLLYFKVQNLFSITFEGAAGCVESFWHSHRGF